MNITQQEIIDYLMGIIEHGSNQDLLDLYNAYAERDLTIDDLELACMEYQTDK